MAYLDMQGIVYQYSNGYCAVDDLTFSAEKGDRIAIIGENGAGKTTTAKLINGLLRPQKGTIRIDGTDTSILTTAQIANRVGYVFQNPDDQIFNKDVYSEIAYSLRHNCVESEEMRRRVKMAAELTSLTNFLDVNPYNLSYSTRKFVSIAIVLAMDTEIVILDEPTACQDRKGLQLLANILDHLERMNKLVITITHDMDFVAENFHRVVVMENSHILFDGSAASVFYNPALMESAALKQPSLCRLAQELRLNSTVLTLEDFVRIANEDNKL